jgi:hypothetical protein
MREAKKWNYAKHQYEPYVLPDNAEFYTEDMDKTIQCASCGKYLIFGRAYASGQIHTAHGLGFSVCEDCYEHERKLKRESESDVE